MVLGPDANEAPLAALTLDLWDELLGHQTGGEVLNLLISISVVLPLIIAEEWLSLFICADFWACSKEWLVATILNLALEALDDRRVGVSGCHVWLTFQVVIELWCRINVEQFATVTSLSLFIFAPLSVSDGATCCISIALGAVSFDH